MCRPGLHSGCSIWRTRVLRLSRWETLPTIVLTDHHVHLVVFVTTTTTTTGDDDDDDTAAAAAADDDDDDDDDDDNDDGDVTVQSRIRTARRYVGVVDDPGDKILIVSCGKDDDGPAGVDVIRQDGRMVRRIVDNKTLTQLRKPLAICVMDNHVMIPDPIHDCVYRVGVTTGLLVDTFTHPHLKKPIQVVADGQGNLYMASRNRQNVLVLTASGQCTSLLQGPQHSDKDYVYPVSLCLTRAGLAVVWRNKQNVGLVIDYSLT